MNNANYKWKVTIEVEGTDGESLPSKTIIQTEQSWKDSKNTRPFGECFAMDVGAATRAVFRIGHVLGGGDMANALAEGYNES